MKNKLHFILCTAFLLMISRAAFAQGFIVNMILPDKTVLIYAVDGALPKVGDTFTVKHNGQDTGVIEVTQDKVAYVLGKIKSSTGDIAEGDALQPAAGKKEEAKKEPAKKEEKKKEEKKESAKKEEKKKPEKKEASKPAEKKVEEAAKQPEPEKKPAPAPRQPRALHPPIAGLTGFTGIFSVISAEKQPARKGIFSYANTSYKGDEELFTSGFSVYAPLRGTKEQFYTITYGLDDHLEMAASIHKGTLPALFGELTGLTSMRATTFGVKYTAEKKYLLKGNTHKKVWYAAGLSTTSFSYSLAPGTDTSGHSKHSTNVFGAVTMQYQKIKWHFDVYHDSMSGIHSSPWKRKWGSALGVEAPLNDKIVLVGDVDRFQGTYLYSGGMRFYIANDGAATLALRDIGNTDQFLISGEYMF